MSALCEESYSRQRRLVGESACEALARSRVVVAGLGGVGSAVFEALIRAGVGHILACDCDVFERGNLNRQLLATLETLGMRKCEAARARARSIDPALEVATLFERVGPDNVGALFEGSPDYVVDAVDSVSAKLAIITACLERGVPVLSCMGTGNRLTADFAITDISLTAASGCPLARVMRRELKKRGVAQGVRVLCGCSPPQPPPDGGRVPASVSFVPPVAGFLMAGEVVRSLIDRSLPSETE